MWNSSRAPLFQAIPWAGLTLAHDTPVSRARHTHTPHSAHCLPPTSRRTSSGWCSWWTDTGATSSALSGTRRGSTQAVSELCRASYSGVCVLQHALVRAHTTTIRPPYCLRAPALPCQVRVVVGVPWPPVTPTHLQGVLEAGGGETRDALLRVVHAHGHTWDSKILKFSVLNSC